MATIRDVASRANVSVSTASRILSNSTKEKYADETRERVREASTELGYRPNFAARALVSGKTRIIAAVFPRFHDSPFTALASLQILSGIEAYCSDEGYHLLISSPKIENGVLDHNFVDLLSGGYLDGVIMDGHSDISSIMEFVTGLKLPLVILGTYPYRHYLRSDNQMGGRLMIEHLIDLGHRRMGLIALRAIEDRMLGVRLAAEGRGLDACAMPCEYGNFSAASGEAAVDKLIRANPGLTAVVAFNDRMAMGAIRRLQELGYQVPEQISVVGHDDLPRSRDFNPPLTTVNHDLSEWGGLAMNMLLTVMHGESPEPITIEPRLVVRQSTAAALND
ncbi:MAG: LacI family DNA-binding transcriptional regulator [Chloroflexi bacterium]|nr:LacI family DNA-binding transcriptional regulator [Chloroflexota bacterium]